ncbi:MAG: hypothetical protein QM727_09865 [Niabella sp.]
MFLLSILIALVSQGQKDYIKIIKEYYRVNPFEGSFPAFIKAVTSDPEVTNKKQFLRTDTSLFLFSGDYKQFNPFLIKTKKVHVVLSENEVGSQGNQSLKDTVLSYQIIAFAEDNETTRRFLLKEFNKIHKKLKRSFKSSEEIDLKGIENVREGKAIHYTWGTYPLSPLTLSWQTVGKDQIAITILSRFAQINGFAIPVGAWMMPYEE